MLLFDHFLEEDAAAQWPQSPDRRLQRVIPLRTHWLKSRHLPPLQGEDDLQLPVHFFCCHVSSFFSIKPRSGQPPIASRASFMNVCQISMCRFRIAPPAMLASS